MKLFHHIRLIQIQYVHDRSQGQLPRLDGTDEYTITSESTMTLYSKHGIYIDYNGNKSKILSPSTDGNNIISRYFEGETILFRIEIIRMISEEFYRDYDYDYDDRSGHSHNFSSMDREFITSMYIITSNNDDYIIHIYDGDLVKHSEYAGNISNNIFLDNTNTNYVKGQKLDISSLSLSCAKTNFSSLHGYIYTLHYQRFIAKLSNIKPLCDKLGYYTNAAYKYMKEQKIANTYSHYFF